MERLWFALVANRALDPGSKLAVESWVADEVHVEGLPEVDVHQLYRAMDFLFEAHDEVQREVFWSVANRFNLEVGLLFLDTPRRTSRSRARTRNVAAEAGDGGADDAADEVESCWPSPLGDGGGHRTPLLGTSNDRRPMKACGIRN